MNGPSSPDYYAALNTELVILGNYFTIQLPVIWRELWAALRI